MTRLVSGTSVLIVVFTIAIVGMRLIGNHDPRMNVLYLFTDPGGSPCQPPCLFGARPGAMTPAQMVSVLKTHPITRRMAEFPNAIAYGGFQNQRMTIFVGSIGGGVRVRISGTRDSHSDRSPISDWPLQAKPIVLNEVITAFGLPEAGLISASDSGPSLTVIYPGKYTIFVFRCVPTDLITPDAPLDEIQIWSDRFPLVFPGSISWMGYGPVNRYPTGP